MMVRIAEAWAPPFPITLPRSSFATDSSRTWACSPTTSLIWTCSGLSTRACTIAWMSCFTGSPSARPRSKGPPPAADPPENDSPRKRAEDGPPPPPGPRFRACYHSRQPVVTRELPGTVRNGCADRARVPPRTRSAKRNFRSALRRARRHAQRLDLPGTQVELGPIDDAFLRLAGRLRSAGQVDGHQACAGRAEPAQRRPPPCGREVHDPHVHAVPARLDRGDLEVRVVHLDQPRAVAERPLPAHPDREGDRRGGEGVRLHGAPRIVARMQAERELGAMPSGHLRAGGGQHR